MILSCNSCEKKFVVPDSAITAVGRLVQCSSCGNKWKQYPINEPIKAKSNITQIENSSKKVKKIIKKKKQKTKKRIGPDLYSPEYLSKKHGIKIVDSPKESKKTTKTVTKVNLGFYNSLIIFIVFLITILRLLYFFQDLITFRFPITEVYINYLFESLNNIKDIFNNFFFGD
tara:strand:- start:4533 stop:5048 length:516 start_codon:yes stop_codon:yes gene_type:complete